MNVVEEGLKCPPITEIDGAERDRKWFLVLGVFSIVLGIVALSAPVGATIASVLLLGSLLLVSGIVQMVQTLRGYKGKEFFLHLVISILYLVVGILMISNPGASAISLALLMAAFFMVGGIFRIIGAVATRFRSWGWVVLNGLITLVLGLIIWANWPLSGLWVIGLFVAIEMMVNGWAMVMFAIAARKEIKEIRRQCEVPA